LRKYLGGDDQQAVFLSEYASDATRKAAIKLTHADPETTEEQLRRWRLAAELSHPNLIRLFERGTWQLNKVQVLYVVMEFADENLGQVIPERPLTAEEAKEMLEPALDALAYLHSKGFVHGSLKPANFLAIDGKLKLSTDSAVQIGVGHAIPADDVWSLGTTLVEALTQQLPVLNEGATRDPALPETLPREFSDIARNSLRLDPRSRWTVSDIQRRLRGEAAPKAPKRFSRAAARSALLVTFLAAVAGTLLLRSREPGTAAESQTKPAAEQPVPSATPIPQPPPPESNPDPQPAPARPAHGDVVQEVLPDVFPRARNSIHGKVVVNVRVDVDPAGNVSGATLESTGTGQYFGPLAEKTARRWKFTASDRPRAWILRFEFTRAVTKVTTVKATP